jgi:hypothetical protein
MSPNYGRSQRTSVAGIGILLLVLFVVLAYVLG